MLVLSRRQNEQILFPELGVVIEVIRLNGNRVKLGISAPRVIKILRGELEFKGSAGSPSNLASDNVN